MPFLVAVSFHAVRDLFPGPKPGVDPPSKRSLPAWKLRILKGNFQFIKLEFLLRKEF